MVASLPLWATITAATTTGDLLVAHQGPRLDDGGGRDQRHESGDFSGILGPNARILDLQRPATIRLLRVMVVVRVVGAHIAPRPLNGRRGADMLRILAGGRDGSSGVWPHEITLSRP